jgi:hypothetical protein
VDSKKKENKIAQVFLVILNICHKYQFSSRNMIVCFVREQSGIMK